MVAETLACEGPLADMLETKRCATYHGLIAAREDVYADYRLIHGSYQLINTSCVSKSAGVPRRCTRCAVPFRRTTTAGRSAPL